MTVKHVSPPAQGWDWLAAPGFNYSISIYFLLRPGETQETDCHSNLFLKTAIAATKKPLTLPFYQMHEEVHST